MGKYYMGLVMVAIIWGANFGVYRFAIETFEPNVFVFLRFGLAVPIFFVLLKLKEGSIGIPWKAALQLMVLGLVGTTILEILVIHSVRYTTLANASLLNVAPWPIFAALFSPLFIRETVSKRLVLGGAAAMVGVIFVILGGGEGLDLSSNHMIGNLLALIVSVLGALYNLGCMPLLKQYSALRVSTWGIFFGALFMFPLTLGSWGSVEWLALTGLDYAALAYNVLICTIVAFIVWNASMIRVGATRSNFFRYLVPAAAVVMGYMLFGETISVWQIVGAVCMAGGLAWISLEKHPAPRSDYASYASPDGGADQIVETGKS